MQQTDTEIDVSPPIPPGSLDQRQAQRYLCIEGGVLRLAVRPAYRGQRAVLMDVSAGGIGFLLGQPLKVGDVLAIDLFLPQGLEACGRLAHVRHCTPHPAPEDAPWLQRRPTVSRFLRRMVGLSDDASEKQAWLVGCEFSRPLAPGELAESLRVLGRSAAN
jgi:hypothetical protein